jgi:hypothetical protein
VCLEGPEAGVYYRGKGEITNNECVEVVLPHYVEKLAYNFTVQVTPIYGNKMVTLNASEVENSIGLYMAVDTKSMLNQTRLM